jgi:TonB-dependent starch-binding outer membrane protein SusC
MNKEPILKLAMFLYLGIFCSIQLLAQSQALSGSVTDGYTGEVLPGASVLIKGTNTGTITDINGKYSIRADKKDTLVLSMVGYIKEIIPVSNTKEMNIKLMPDILNLTEVVVIGYGNTTKKDLTGSISTVNSKDFQKGIISSPDQLIVGKVAGVQVVTNGGQPGGGSTIRIRGGASLNASNDPLIVVDGVPLSNSGIPGVANPMSLINPNDIETMTILKDANATAIYGSRASNGIIIITTKKGISGKLKINFSTQNSLATVTKIVDVLSADEVRNYVNENGSAEEKAMLGSANTNWQDEIYRTAPVSDNNLSISGGYKDICPYRFSLGYLYQDGTLIRDNMKRVSGNVSINPKFFNKHLKVDLNLNGTTTKSQFANQDAISNAIIFDPTQPVYSQNDYGGYYEWLRAGGELNPNAPKNPVSLIELKDDKGKTDRSFGNLQLDYSLHFLPELHANVNLGYDISTGKGSVYIPAYAAMSAATNGNYNEYKLNTFNKVVEFYLSYVKDLASIKSNINVTAGYGYYANWQKSYNFKTYEADSTTVIYTPTYPNDIPQNRLLSYYGRLIYTYNNKYILSGTIRTDGSSRFSAANRWGLFPSAALTWKISSENFMKDISALSDLKLRLSYGVTGQQEGIANYSYMPNYSTSSNESMYQFGETYYYMFAPSAFDASVKWETTTTYNAGLDFGFLKNRIGGSLDIYEKKTKDLLSNTPIPAGSNFNNFLLTNVGNMEDKGVEFAINGKPIIKNNFSWDLGFNITWNEMKVTNLTSSYDPEYMISQGRISGLSDGYIQAFALNKAPYTYYVYKQLYGEDGKPLEGVFVDLNGDGKVDENDRYFYKSPAPKYTIGFSTAVNYKKWSLNTVLRANLGNYVYNNAVASISSKSTILNTGAGIINNTSTDFLNTDFNLNQYLSDYYIQNASFLKMDNVGLVYKAGKIFKHNSSVDLTISANVQNVFTVTNYKGVDPEIYNGIDNRFYPRPRVFVLGLNLEF